MRVMDIERDSLWLDAKITMPGRPATHSREAPANRAAANVRSAKMVGRDRVVWATEGKIKSGQQTLEGRAHINAATSARMRAFWQAWREAGRPPLPWREALRTARAKPKPTPPPPKPPPKPMRPLSPEEIEFGKRIGLLKG
jgi:hypothetical protein